MPSADDIRDAALAIAADGVASATVDGNSAQAVDPEKLQRVAAREDARVALSGSNENGGPKSPWRMLRPARVVPPGGV